MGADVNVPMPLSHHVSRSKELRRNLRFLVGDGVCWAVMTGTGEWQFVLFALAIGLSEVQAGLVSTVPILLGALLQLVTRLGLDLLGADQSISEREAEKRQALREAS